MGIIAQIVKNNFSLSGSGTYGDVYISIFDTVTNLPTNGNNCSVLYSQNINGVTTTPTVVVSGLSALIYSGELYDFDVSVFYSQFYVISTTPGTGIPPSPSADDLVIVNVLTTPQSAIGANDGIVTINATSSFPAITYSLDNITYQSSNIFTGRIYGAGIAYAKDTNGGLVNLPYTVGLLGNILVTDPIVDLGNGNLSRWNAAYNNIWFKYQRKDYQITSITLDTGSGNILVAVNADMSNVTIRTITNSLVPGQPTITSPGDLVYIKTAKYSGSFEVLSKTAGTLILNTAWTINDTTGFININSLRPKYKIQTIVTYVDPITGKFGTIVSNNYPFPDGSCNVDLSSFLQSLLRAKDYSNYNLVNYRDMQLSASYTIQYAEIWTGNTPQFAVITRPYYLTYTARQIQQLGGGNMQEFVPYLLGFQPAKWVNDMINPVYNHFFPFDLGFIFSEYMVGLAPYYTIVLLDINMQPLVSQTVNPTFLLNENGSFILNQDGSKFIIAQQGIPSFPIVEHVGLNRLLINFTPPSSCWYFSVQLKYDFAPPSGSVITYPLTQPIVCRVDQNTPDRQVYLKWIGLTGSWQYYTFVYNQKITLEVTNEVTVKNFITNWAATDTISEVISKNAGKRMTVFAENMTANDIDGIEAIKYSPKVMMYVGPAISGTNWITVDTGANSYDERETYVDADRFALTFKLPDINIQTQ